MSEVADNYVSISIKASDQAKPDLTDLKEKLQELGREVETAKVDVDDADGEVKLLRLNAKLADLNAKTSNPKISIAGAARAEAEIAAVSMQMDKLKEKADETAAEGAAAGGGGLIGRLFFGTGGAGASLSAAMGPAGMLGIAGALAAALPEVVAVGSGFAAAGAGAAAFGALAIPAIKNVETAYTSLSTAQQGYQDAQAKYAADPSKSNLAGLKTAAQNLQLVKAQMDKMPQSEQGALSGIQGLVTQFGKLSTAFEPQAFKVFNATLGVANSLLPHITPFANTFADALTRLLGQAGKFTASAGFASWLNQFHSLEGPALGAIGDGIGKVASAFGKLLTVFSGKDVATGITIAFDILAGAITGVRVVVEGLKAAWDKFSQDPAIKKIATDIKTAWDDISTTGKKKPDFSGLQSALKDAVQTAVNWLSLKLKPLIKQVMDDAGTWLKNNAYPILEPVGKALMAGLIDGIKSNIPSLLPVLGDVAGFIASHKGPIEKDRLLLVPAGQAMIDGLGAGMLSRLPNLRGDLNTITGAIAGTGVGRGLAAGGAGGQGVVHLQVTGGGAGLDGLFASWLKNYVRASGGDPGMFNRKVAFQ